MKKETPTLVAFLIIFFVLFLSGFLYIYSQKRSQYFTDIDTLYALFTSYMKNEVNSRLQLLNCSPKEYYYDDSSVCLVCGDIHPCFGFGWVKRTGGKRMNLKGISYLKNVKEINVKIVDFYQKGLASKLNCKKKGNEILECENDIKFLMENSDIKMLLDDSSKFNVVSEKICSHFGEKISSCTSSKCNCGKYLIVLQDNEILIYVYGK